MTISRGNHSEEAGISQIVSFGVVPSFCAGAICHTELSLSDKKY